MQGVGVRIDSGVCVFVCVQLKKMFFDLLRDRVAQLYSQRQKRSTQRKNLQHFTDQYCSSIVGRYVHHN